MALLKIDLQDGFSQDAVRIFIDGVSVYEADDVATNYAIGVASSTEVDVPPGTYDVAVEVPGKGLIARIAVTIDGPAYLGVSIENGQITFRRSEEMFRYL